MILKSSSGVGALGGRHNIWSRPYISPHLPPTRSNLTKGVPTTALLTDGTRTILGDQTGWGIFEGGQDRNSIYGA